MRVEADAPGMIHVGIRPQIPFVGKGIYKDGDGYAKSGEVTAEGDRITLHGKMEFYGTLYEGQLRVIADGGTVTPSRYQGRIWVENANALTVIFGATTNYRMESRVFEEEVNSKKLEGYPDPHDEVTAIVDAAAERSYETLLERHLKDYRALYSRVSLSLNEECPNLTTDELLHEYQKGNHHRYLETLLFQYGRYLLIASSRTRLPANLQGIWNQYASTPWFGGYANNINVQMNYWMNGPANLRELFIPYINYAKAYMPWAKTLADRFVGEFYPHRLQEPSNNGWLLGVTANAYYVEALRKVTHSGPGMGAMTSLLFWDYYDYTRDIEFLREFGYPALRDMSVFFSRMLENIDGKMLVFDSASPENFHNGEPYHTTGCAFDQQMIYENDKRTLQAAEILGIEEPILNEIRERLPLLDPVLIGESGQVKEYREETTYGSIGDPRHRHVSHLMGLYPGTLINRETPEWLEGAKVTLDGRGDRIGIGGWPLIHRLLLRARTCEADKALELIYSFVDDITENLWAKHRVFQVEGSLGYVAGVCEMLMQSQAGYIELLPALPCEWKDGSFEGLVARGAFVVDCVWEGGTVQHLSITSEKGERVSVKVPKGLKPSKEPVAFNGEIAVFDTAVGEKISFEK
jgi:alpha-L-fucosidase 2